MSKSMWGEKETQYFFELTPERILDAVEASGLRCTGRCLTLNSMENRVYEVELEIDDPSTIKLPSERFRIAKFYRPGRWTPEQILEEHAFLADLQAVEIPAVGPSLFQDGKTLHKMPELDIWYSVFPKVGGRSPDELSDEQLEQAGRLIARMHNVGAASEAKNRLHLTPEVYGIKNLQYLLDHKSIPFEFESRYKRAVEKICELSQPLFDKTPVQRIHGDAHLGNLLWGGESAFWVDFDDMVVGPCMQDLWLILSGRDEWSVQKRNILIDGYEQMRDFDWQSLRLLEPLRSLRIIHFNAWISKRWKDPAFPKAFPLYGTNQYWADEVRILEDQVEVIDKMLNKSSSGYSQYI